MKDDMEEVWKIIPGNNDRVQVSSLGRVRKLSGKRVDSRGWVYSVKEKVHKGSYDDSGYVTAAVKINGAKANVRIHRLVMAAFVGPANGRHVDHINGIRDDNRLVNLRYCTIRENNTIYSKFKPKSGIKNIYSDKGAGYRFAIKIGDKIYRGSLKKTPHEAAKYFFKFKTKLPEHKEIFDTHPINNLKFP